MADPVAQYLTDIQKALQTGHAQEHSYRPALEALFKATTSLKIINEPKGSAHGRPDFIFLKGEVPIAWVEAKDLHVNLDKIEKSEQMTRYFGYANLILTNGLEFRFFKNGERYVDTITIATKKSETLTSTPETYDLLARTLTDFVSAPIITIKSAEHLAKIMGGKARRIRDNITAMLDPNFPKEKRGDIESVMNVLKTKLIHDLNPEQFADLYAQTLVYGLFVARYNDSSPETFSRMEAREKIPASNHLLQQFFDHIAGVNFVKKLAYIVDELCDVFVHANVHDLVHGLYQQMNLEGETHDPIIHFYEDFLREYDPALRMQRGVFYTPLPVVRYIVRSVDALLKEHFGLKDGLADRAKTDFVTTVQGKKSTQQIDRVQILDPAVGTGTFLNEVIREIHTKFKGQEGMWPSFVNDHLIPRLNGFELMMASYTIAHLKLSMTLAETGIKTIKKRLRVFLTNSLEEAPQKDDTLFASLGLDGALTEESEAAAEVKRDLPIMVVMGNPPYSGHSANKGEWIESLLDAYKKEPGGGKLREKNSKWLNDDYVKFLRFSEHLIEKMGEGVVAMITNHSYLDNPTFRGMRWHLLQTFDDIYIIDLHGNSKKKEVNPDGSKDENVFDIQQGVSIFLAIRKRGKKKELATIHRADIYGKREQKYSWLDTQNISTTKWEIIKNFSTSYVFKKQDAVLKTEYDTSFSLTDLFPLNGTGIVTKRDEMVIQYTPQSALQSADDMLHLPEVEMRQKYNLPADVRDWRYDWAQKDVRDHGVEASLIRPIIYRPFDRRYLYYTGQSRGFMGWPVFKLMKHMLNENNIALFCLRQSRNGLNSAFFVSKEIAGKDILTSLDIASMLPLYIYPTSPTVSGENRTANLDMKLLTPALKNLKLEWISDGIGDGKKTCGPEDILDYIYAVLHCPTYRERYKEFLKIDFPRVPFTSNPTLFWRLVKVGRDIRLLHLMESSLLESLITSYPKDGSNTVEKVTYDEQKKRVFINKDQYFEGIELDVWAFYIGGYQPLQKWLKDRKGRTLTSDDILHYQRIVIALKETERLMKEIDQEISKAGGWPMK